MWTINSLSTDFIINVMARGGKFGPILTSTHLHTAEETGADHMGALGHKHPLKNDEHPQGV